MSRKVPTLPDQALPPELRKKPLPPAFEAVLPSGLAVKWRMPDVFQMIAFDGVVPDPLTAGVLALLEEEKSARPEADPRRFQYSAQAVKGMYALAGSMLEEPTFNPSVEYGENGTLGRRELGYLDLTSLYWLFRISSRQSASSAPNPAIAGGSALAAPDSDGVPHDAGGAGGDS